MKRLAVLSNTFLLPALLLTSGQNFSFDMLADSWWLPFVSLAHIIVGYISGLILCQACNVSLE